MSLSKKAQDDFLSGLNCSQSIIAQYASDYQLDIGTACKLACGFGGGMGRMGGTCGALSGAYLVLGLHFGAENNQQRDQKNLTYQKIQELSQQFQQLHGAYQCRDLLGCDISSSEGLQQAKALGATNKCPEYVKDAARLLEQMLDKQKNHQ